MMCAQKIYSSSLITIIMNFQIEPKPLMEVVAGGLSAATACMFTNPLEVVKNRLQLQGELLARGEYVKTYRGPVHGLMVMARTDGLASLQAGLGPAMLYQVS